MDTWEDRMAAERAAREAHDGRMARTCRAVARELSALTGEDWLWTDGRNSPRHGARFEGPSEFTLGTWWGDRLQVRLRWPEGQTEPHEFDPRPYVRDRPREPSTLVTLDPSRPPERLAADIERRLLRPARPLWVEALRQRNAADAANTAFWGHLEELAQALGGTTCAKHGYPPKGRPEGAARGWYGRGDAPSAKLTMERYDPSRMTLELRGLPAEARLQLMRVLGNLMDLHEPPRAP